MNNYRESFTDKLKAAACVAYLGLLVLGGTLFMGWFISILITYYTI